MILYPETCIEDLEFDKLLKWMSDRAMSVSTVDRINAQRLDNDVETIRENLKLVEELKEAAKEGIVTHLDPFEDLREILQDVRPANRVIPLEDIIRVKVVLEQHAYLAELFRSEEVTEEYPNITALIHSNSPLLEIVQETDRIFDESGQVRDDASEELRKVRSKIDRVMSKIDRSFDQVIEKHRSSNVLLDSPESFKNGRRVLAVKAEYKRQIQGILHDQSSTGQTAYIEPQEIVMMNNDLFDLQSEEKREIHKILLGLCDLFRAYSDEIENILKIIIEIDFIRVKSELARYTGGELPKITDQPKIQWMQARHPLLKLKNDAIGKPVVPSDIILFGKNRMMVISGPNAGGKSIALKTIGLLQLMIQYGMLPTCDPSSEAGLFKEVMVDIGDQQSIENDLSTYSSRLQKMAHMMREASEDSLILIDEFGSGTDPTTGGALAEAMLRHLLYRKSWGVVTTHYSNLKVFAFKNRGIVNASMSFDTDSISPTYELDIGKPGSSFAFEIAEKMELPEVVLKNARRRLGEKQVKVEDLLNSLQSEKQQLENELARSREHQSKLDHLIKNYERLAGELDYKRKKLKLQAREERVTREAEFNRQLENTIREIQESKNLEKAKSLASEKKEEKKALMKEMSDLQEDIIEHEKVDSRPIRVGDHVKMKNGDVSGEVLELNNDIAQVGFGALKVEVPTRDLKIVGAPLKVNPKKSIQTDIFDRAANFRSKLDIRGLKMDEARDIIQNYLDEAVVIGIDQLEIVHGKGSGVLRRVVRDKAREYKQVKSLDHPAPEDGGEGITIIAFR
ncbi:MAG: endonuclease MutS2 [Saprospiraceae bacterium]|nr:endonuclease MutS2 [Saprospiraceae bacterium]